MRKFTIMYNLKKIKSGEAKKCERAAKKLIKARDARAVKPLIAMLEDESTYVQTTAVFALGGICDMQAIPPLLEKIKDSSEEVRNAAALALGMIRDMHTTHQLVPMLGYKDNNAKSVAEEKLRSSGYEWASEMRTI